jgi:hypothetical protein
LRLRRRIHAAGGMGEPTPTPYFWITDPGCRFGWYIAKPDYSLNTTVLRFDLIASTVNAIVYFILVFAGALLFKRTIAKMRRNRPI